MPLNNRWRSLLAAYTCSAGGDCANARQDFSKCCPAIYGADRTKSRAVPLKRTALHKIQVRLRTVLRQNGQTYRPPRGLPMAKPNYSFAKRQRDLAKEQKKEEKLQRKQAEKAEPVAEEGEAVEQQEQDKPAD